MARPPRSPDDQLDRPAGSLGSSDVFQRYTATYTWAANQTSHVGLGLLAALLVGRAFPAVANDWYWALAFVPYTLKEANDVRRARAKSANAFRLEMGELLADSLTDWFFVSTGIALGLAALFRPSALWYALLVLPVGYLAMRHFVPIKRSFDKSGLPFFSRLALLGRMPQAAQRDLAWFSAAEPGTALVVHGPHASGKTTLAVAVANELALARTRVLYLSSAKFRDEIGRALADPSPLDAPWTVGESEVLVVDDTGPEFLAADAARAGLSQPTRRCVWVLTPDLDRQLVVEQLGLGEERCRVIDAGELRRMRA